MAYTDPSSINASKGIFEILTYLNVVTNNWFANMLMISIFVIFSVAYYKSTEDFKGALAVSTYGTLIISLFFWIIGFLSNLSFGVIVGATLLATIVLLTDARNQ